MNPLPEDLRSLTSGQRSLLATLLQRARTHGPKPPALSSRVRNQRTRASFSQERVWVLSELASRGDEYHIQAALQLRGELDKMALRWSLQELVRRHEILRTRFEIVDGTLDQIIEDDYEVEVEEHDLRADGKEAYTTSFDLQRLPLFKIRLLQTGEYEWILVMVLHHIIGDGWSLAILESELAELYSSRRKQEPAHLVGVTSQYADYSDWQRERMGGASLQHQSNWWKEKLTGSPGLLRFPHRNGSVASDKNSAAGRLSRGLGPDLTRKLKEVAIATASTPFIVLLSALAIVLSRWVGQSDFTIGTVAGHRPTRETERAVGPFINYLPLRLQLSAEGSISDLIQGVRNCVYDAFEHADCPFEKVVEALNARRGGNPLYNVGFVVQNFPSLASSWDGLETRPEITEVQTTPLDLFWTVAEVDQSLEIHCDYRLNTLQQEDAQELLNNYISVIQAVVAQKCERVSDIELTLLTTGSTPILAVAATFAADPIVEPLRFWIRKLQLQYQVELAPYNQIFQQLLQPDSLLRSNHRGTDIVLLRAEDWHRDSSFTMRQFAAALLGNQRCQAIVVLCPPSSRLMNDLPEWERVKNAESELSSLIQGSDHIELITWKQITDFYPVANPLDEASDRLGHVPYTALCFTAIATMIARRVRAVSTPPFKAVVVDADDTLWDGVCGEVGPHGVVLSDGRRLLQEFLLQQRNQGMLLCLCSKNDEAIVRETFDAHPDMPLQPEHFAAWGANWNPKSANVQALASQLNIGLESVIFLDNSEIECADIEAFCPSVLCLRVPSQPAQIPKFLRHTWAFDLPRATTGVDRNRFYRQNLLRVIEQQLFHSLDDFITSLRVTTELRDIAPSDIPRVSELTMRTNQFNCNAVRRTPAAISRLVSAREFTIWTVSVKDRFGDYGLCGVLSFRPVGETLEVETFLLSCRALGRRVEDRMLDALIKEASDLGLSRVVVPLIETERNQPAQEFLTRVGYRDLLNPSRFLVNLEPAEKAVKAVYSLER